MDVGWRSQRDVPIRCFSFRKSGNGKFTEYKSGRGKAFHDIMNGHYEHTMSGACTTTGTWQEIPKSQQFHH